MLEILTLPLGPLSTNAYLLADPVAGEAVVVDPGWDGPAIAAAAREHGWSIRQVWLTHAHFDHFGGLAGLADALENPHLPVALHPADRDLYEQGGLGKGLGYDLPPGPRPLIDLAQTTSLSVGTYPFQVRHAPGHTPGMCIFYCAQAQVLFSGDLIFFQGVGRTDLPGGDWDELVRSIETQVYSLPDATRILPGHGEATSVGEERDNNPFVRA